MTTGPTGRETWEERWSRRDRRTFSFHLEEVPPQLREVVEQFDVSTDAALDLGCGASVVTPALAELFDTALGIDLAVAAVVQARDSFADGDGGPSYVAADASHLPLADGSLSFVFDRGCMQNMPRELWPAYFAEVTRVLRPGGVLQLFASRVLDRPVATLAGRARSLIGRRRRGGREEAAFTSERLRRLVPPSLDELRLERIPFRLPNGQDRVWIHGVFRRTRP